MKIVTFILSIFILFLTVKPEVELILFNIAAEHCCDQLPFENSTTDHKEPCNTLACNPFHGCSTCKNVFINSSFSPYQNLSEPVSCYFIAETSFISFYIPDFWKPPKFV